MKKTHPYPILSFGNQLQWDAWLCEHHAESKGVWLKIAKKESVVAAVSYVEALESALCFGWIDGQKASCNEQFWLQKFTPRGPKSSWSQINCAKAVALIADGRMRPAGIQQIEQAQADGCWQAAYASQRTITVPADFQAESYITKNTCRPREVHVLRVSSFVFASQSRREGIWSS